MDPYIEQIAGEVYDFVTRTWHPSFKTKNPEGVLHSTIFHHDILDALQQRDPAKAARANRKHLEQFIEQIYRNAIKKG